MKKTQKISITRLPKGIRKKVNDFIYKEREKLKRSVETMEDKEEFLEKLLTEMRKDLTGIQVELEKKITSANESIEQGKKNHTRIEKVFEERTSKMEESFQDIKEKINFLGAEKKMDFELIKKDVLRLNEDVKERVEAFLKIEKTLGGIVKSEDERKLLDDEKEKRINMIKDDLEKNDEKLTTDIEKIAQNTKKVFDQIKLETREEIEKEMGKLGFMMEKKDDEKKKMVEELKKSLGGENKELVNKINDMKNEFEKKKSLDEEKFSVLGKEIEESKQKKTGCPYLPRNEIFPFTAIVGQEKMKKILILNSINPSTGGVLLWGVKGIGKSTAIRGIAEIGELNPSECKFAKENGCSRCEKRYETGLLSLTSKLVMHSEKHNAEYLLDKLSNSTAVNMDLGPEEMLRFSSPDTPIPPAIKRIALKIRVEPLENMEEKVEVIKRRKEFEDSDRFRKKFEKQQRMLKDRIKRAKENLKFVTVPENIYKMIGEMCKISANSIIIEKLARAQAAYEGRKEVTIDDVTETSAIVLEEEK